MDKPECPKCGEKKLLEYGIGVSYGMELEYWTCFNCMCEFGGDLDGWMLIRESLLDK